MWAHDPRSAQDMSTSSEKCSPGLTQYLLVSLIIHHHVRHSWIIAWLSLNFVLSISWVALYSVVWIGVTRPNLHFFQYMQAYKPSTDSLPTNRVTHSILGLVSLIMSHAQYPWSSSCDVSSPSLSKVWDKKKLSASGKVNAFYAVHVLDGSNSILKLTPIFRICFSHKRSHPARKVQFF